MSKILVVDDEEVILKLFLMILSEKHEVVCCSSAQEAFERFRFEAFDLVITDVKMPKEDGISFTNRIKKLNPDVPVILVTGHGDKKTAVQALKLGAFDFIEKPFDDDELLVSVEKAIEYYSERKRYKLAKSILRRKHIEIKNLVQKLSKNEESRTAELAGDVIHEIKSPLTVADFLINKVIDQVSSSADKNETVENAKKSSAMIKRTFEVISSVRALIDEYSFEHPQQEDISEIFDDVVSFVQDGFDRLGVELRVIKPIEKRFVKCQFVSISQVLINLLNNARDAVGQQAEKWVQLEVGENQQKFEILVTDSGKGIPDDVKEKIFTPFFTTKKGVKVRVWV